MTRKRRGWLWGFLFVLACAPGLALAAEDKALGDESYTVKKGDTLWGIAKELLQDPVLWPNLWQKNPFITNPNKIFPGDRLSLPGKVVAPPPVVEAPKPAPPKEERRAEPPPPPPPAPVVAAPPPRPQRSLYGPEVMACVPLLTADEPSVAAGIGSIVRTDDARTMVMKGDRIQVGLTGGHAVSPGDRLTIFQPGQRVMHPVTGKPAGRAQIFRGILEVQEVTGQTARGQIAYSCGEITLGDRVMPFSLSQFPDGKTPKPAAAQAQGIILESTRMVQILGPAGLIFLDVGAGQGVGSGDVFSVFRQGKPVTNDQGVVFGDKPERLGEALVLRVTEQAATAVLTSTLKECRAGDQVVLTHQMPR